MSDMRSDIYSMGIAMYEMVTGRVPFDGDSVVTVALKHIREDIVPPSGYVDIPYSLDQIILKATLKNPDLRYQTMDEMVLDLKHSLLDPEGDFVRMPYGTGGAYALMSTQEVRAMEEEERRHRRKSYRSDDDTDELPYDEDDDDELSGGTKRINKVLLGVIIAMIVAIAIFAIGSATGLFRFAGGDKKTEKSETVKVPDLVGMTEKEAVEKLDKIDLKLKVVSEEESDKYDKGVVISQKTASGTKVPRGSTVPVVLSSGKVEEITIPDVSGMEEDEAKQKLKDAGFKKTDSEYTYDETAPEGTVIETSPAIGTKVPADQTVIVKVSKGSESVSVPNIVGMTKDAAMNKLGSVGLQGSATSKYSDSVPEGQVISQNPYAGTKLATGSTVSYVVSKGVQNVSVPTINGSSEANALSALKAAGLKGTALGNIKSDEPLGTVIKQKPAGGKEVAPGSTVTYYISLGPDSEE